MLPRLNTGPRNINMLVITLYVYVAGAIPCGDGDAEPAARPVLQREAQVHRQRLRLHRLQRLRARLLYTHHQGT